MDDAADILDSILEEEKAADSALTEVAETAINVAATEEEAEYVKIFYNKNTGCIRNRYFLFNV